MRKKVRNASAIRNRSKNVNDVLKKVVKVKSLKIENPVDTQSQTNDEATLNQRRDANSTLPQRRF